MIVFVTGGTGLIGSNVCAQLIERGDEVRALARPGSEVGPLREMGVTIVEGDTNGDGVGDFGFEVRGVHTFTAADCIL